MPKKKTEKRLKVSLTLEKKEAFLLKLLAKYTGATQGEVVAFLLDTKRLNVKNTTKELKAMKDKQMENEIKKLEEELGSV